jgi:alpha-glucosidase
MEELKRFLWWQSGIIYQIYPLSYMDSDGDGIGDLRGIRSKLDYLQWLGIDAVWISPIFPSPMKDFGYDISDYTDIDPRFGTMSDFHALLDDAHARNIKVILDFVPNHTSDQHPWFIESRFSRDNPKRDWYLWQEPKPDGDPPNNWLSVFGGSAWQFEPQTGQYYYHAFLKEQPDLNWRNADAQRAMLDIMRFWLGKGVDGFRVDVMAHLIKDAQLRNNPKNPDYRETDLPFRVLIPAYSMHQPEVHELVAKMRRVTEEYQERVLIGEIYLPITELVTYYGLKEPGAHLPFNFQLISLPWEAPRIAAAITEYEAALPENGWPNWVLSNHDKSRIASRVGADQARVAAMLLLTLRGTPTIYYGDEIGMPDVDVPRDRVHDPLEKNVPGRGLGRDKARTPMQWDGTQTGGFTSGKPWLPISPDHQYLNVESERENPQSMLRLYRRLIALRRSEPALSVGNYAPVESEGDIVAYIREYESRRMLVVANLGHRPQSVPLRQMVIRTLLSTHVHRENESIQDTLELRSDEAVIAEIIRGET